MQFGWSGHRAWWGLGVCGSKGFVGFRDMLYVCILCGWCLWHMRLCMRCVCVWCAVYMVHAVCDACGCAMLVVGVANVVGGMLVVGVRCGCGIRI